MIAFYFFCVYINVNENFFVVRRRVSVNYIGFEERQVRQL